MTSIRDGQSCLPVPPAEMAANCAFERTLSKGGICSARATNKFARASLGVGRRGAAQRGRYAAHS